MPTWIRLLLRCLAVVAIGIFGFNWWLDGFGIDPIFVVMGIWLVLSQLLDPYLNERESTEPLPPSRRQRITNAVEWGLYGVFISAGVVLAAIDILSR